jgi:hypothetical protein
MLKIQHNIFLWSKHTSFMGNMPFLTFASQEKLGHIPYTPGWHVSLGDHSRFQVFAESPLPPLRMLSEACCMETFGDLLAQPWIQRADHSLHNDIVVLL